MLAISSSDIKKLSRVFEVSSFDTIADDLILFPNGDFIATTPGPESTKPAKDSNEPLNWRDLQPLWILEDSITS